MKPLRAGPDWTRLLPALLDFERSPGRYPVRLREPRPLFECIGSVMRLASGAELEDLPATPWNEAELHRVFEALWRGSADLRHFGNRHCLSSFEASSLTATQRPPQAAENVVER